MSLTNQMLKNLKMRQAQTVGSSDIIEDLSPAKENSLINGYRASWLYFLFTVSLFVFLINFGFMNKPDVNSAPSAETAIVAKSMPILAKEETPKKGVKADSEKEVEAVPYELLKNSNTSLDLPKLYDNRLPLSESKVAVKTEVKPSLEEKIDQAYEYALSLIAENKPKDAMEILQGILQTEPEDNVVRTTLATLLLQEGNNEEAQHVLSAGLQLEPNDATLMELYARAQINQNQYEQALASLLKISATASNDIEYNALLASIYQHLNKAADAVAVYQKLVNEEPYNPRWMVGLGISLEQLGDKNAALQTYQKAKNNRQISPELLSFVINRLQALGVMN